MPLSLPVRVAALVILHLVMTAASTHGQTLSVSQETEPSGNGGPYLRVLGIAQDAGYPQAGCNKDCCQDAWQDVSLRRYATSLAVCDPATGNAWLLDCTPDFKHQLRMLQPQTSSAQTMPATNAFQIQAIFLTHAHIGHYTGLMHLGREVMGLRRLLFTRCLACSRF